MLDQIDLKRKGLVVTRLLKTVDEYFEAYGEPVPMQALAAKYARALEKLGGFPEVVDQLRDEGAIEVVLKPTGAKLIYPENCALRIDPKSRLLK